MFNYILAIRRCWEMAWDASLHGHWSRFMKWRAGLALVIYQSLVETACYLGGIVFRVFNQLLKQKGYSRLRTLDVRSKHDSLGVLQAAKDVDCNVSSTLIENFVHHVVNLPLPHFGLDLLLVEQLLGLWQHWNALFFQPLCVE